MNKALQQGVFARPKLGIVPGLELHGHHCAIGGHQPGTATRLISASRM